MACRDLARCWRRCVVPLYIDNRSFQASAAKGWSKAERLAAQLKELFAIAVQAECVFEFHWISTHDNVLADALSREGGESLFVQRVVDSGFLGSAVLQRHVRSGAVRRFGRAFSSDEDGDGPGRGSHPVKVAMTVPYTRASVYVGLPSQELVDGIEDLMGTRLSGSSHGSISAALGHWNVVCARHRWGQVIASDDPSRGAKLATFVLYMVNETDLVASSIAN